MRVLVAWELGGSLGHLARQLALARALRARGHRILFALRDLSQAQLLARAGFAFLPAPVPARPRRTAAYRSYAQMLGGEAFTSANAALVGALAWRTIFQAARPDVLIADHAPGALLAARAMKLRTVLFGSPFSIPRHDRPLPRFFRSVSDAPEHEKTLLERLNRALAGLRARGLERPAELYRADLTLIESFPEIDCFGARPPQAYCHPIAADAGAAVPPWPKARGAKYLVYLRSGPWLRPLFEALEARQAGVVGYVPGLRANGAARSGLHLGAAPLKASVLIAQCDAVICHGGHGMVAKSLAAGKPLLLLPNYVEQALTSALVAKLGAGVLYGGEPEPKKIESLCAALEPGKALAAAGVKFAQRVRLKAPANGAQALAERIEKAVAP